MLVSVTVNSVNKFSSFITAYLPGCLSKVKKCNIKTKANVTSVSQRKRLLRRICSQDSYCIGFYLSADGVSLALISTLLLILDSFCAGTKTIRDNARRISRRRNFANDSSKHGINITILVVQSTACLLWKNWQLNYIKRGDCHIWSARALVCGIRTRSSFIMSQCFVLCSLHACWTRML